MRDEIFRHKLLLAVSIAFVVQLVPWLAASQERISRNPTELDAKLTSFMGPLQDRLFAAFPEAFKPGVDIIWGPGDGWVSQEVFNWWKGRLSDSDRVGVTPEAARRMFSRLSESTPVFSDRRRRRICAVVGASRNLLGSRYGNLIDGHEVVIRVNRAPTDDFDSDVGTRTTHHVTWPRELEEWEYDREAFHLMTPIATHTNDIFDRILYVADEYQWDPARVRIIHPGFVKYLHESWTKGRMTYPSTGFIALMLAVHVCDEVDVFGFGADASGRWDRYYEEVVEDVSMFHAPDFEGRLRRDMEDRGIIKVFRGNRP